MAVFSNDKNKQCEVANVKNVKSRNILLNTFSICIIGLIHLDYKKLNNCSLNRL